jgi:hypothetical protein
MMMQVSVVGERPEIIGLDWDTLEINARGIFPVDNAFSDFIAVSYSSNY